MFYKLYNGDCLEVMKDIPDRSIDMILCDLPYGTLKTISCDGWKNKEVDISWDKIIDIEKLFNLYNRILRQNGAILLFSKSPLTEMLRTQKNPNIIYHYSFIWKKNNFSNPYIAKKVPLSICENIDVFFKEYSEGNEEYDRYRFFVKKWINKSKKDILEICGQSVDHFFRNRTKQFITEEGYNNLIDKLHINLMPNFLTYQELKNIKTKSQKTYNIPSGSNYVLDLLEFSKDNNNLHPTQKPVKLLEYLIKIYSNKNDVVLDNCMGSGSTGVACQNLNRNFIGIELDKKYFEIAKNRIEENN